MPLALVLLGCSTVRSVEPEPEMEGLWVLQIRRQVWKPRDLEFVVRFEDDASRSAATLDPVFSGRTIGAITDVTADRDTTAFSLRSRMDGYVYRFEGRLDGGTMDGVVRYHDGQRDQVDPFTGFRRDVRRFDTALDGFAVEEDPRAVGVEPVLLDRLLLGAEIARSDALLVLAEGKLVAARTFGAGDVATGVGALSAAVTRDGRSLRPSEIGALGQAWLDGGTWTGPALFPLHDPTDERGPALGFGTQTHDGEALLIYPEAKLVVVRTLHRVENGWDRRYDERDGMEWLDEMAEAIAVEKLGRPPVAR
jgi:hypothetical protein